LRDYDRASELFSTGNTSSCPERTSPLHRRRVRNSSDGNPYKAAKHDDNSSEDAENPIDDLAAALVSRRTGNDMSYFTEERLERYSRNIILKEIGVEGQERFHNGRVLIIGMGGLGSPAALYLAAAGVGAIGVADADVVDLSNLQRQVIHRTADLGRVKVESAAEKIRAINPDVVVQTYHAFVSAENINELIAGYDFVIDAVDNFPAKFLINDACVLAGIPFSHGGVLRFQGQTMTVLPGRSACYRCVFDKLPPKNAVPTCSQAGVLGAIAGMLGTIQAVEALKYIAGAGQSLADSLLTFDALTMNFRKLHLRRNPLCPLCGEHPTITHVFDEEPAAVCDLKNNAP
jgi:molybdopterin-synthase adenylyltransferase